MSRHRPICLRSSACTVAYLGLMQRCRWFREWWGVEKLAGPLHRKEEIVFIPRMINICINRLKTQTVNWSLRTQILLFNRKKKLIKTVQSAKIIQKIHGQTKGSHHRPPPIRYWFCISCTMPSALKGYSFEKRRVLSMTSYQGGPRGVSKNRPCHTRIYPWLTYLLTWIIHRFSRDLFRPPGETVYVCGWGGRSSEAWRQRSVTSCTMQTAAASKTDVIPSLQPPLQCVKCDQTLAQQRYILHDRSAVLHPLLRVQLRQRLCRMWISHCYRQQGISRRVSRLITGGSFSSDFGPFRGLKIGVLMGCLGETSIFKIIIIDRDTLWPKLEYTW